MNRRRILTCGLASMGACAANISSIALSDETTSPAPPRSRSLIAKLSQFLWRSQSDDGRWSSSTYALLRSGQALTPFVLSTLLKANAMNRDTEQANMAKKWILAQLRGGALGLSDAEVLEYPVFASAFAMSCLVLLDSPEHDAPIAALRRFLLNQQLVETRGFKPSDLAYGGWGFGGVHAPGQSGHMDLSHTRWALTALSASAAGADSRPYQSKAQRFLRLVQKCPDEDREVPLDDGHGGGNIVQHNPPYDGGFYFSPIVLAANKGRLQRAGDRSYVRSYATATCDGVMALLAAGVHPHEERILSARHWLEANPDWEYPAGIPKDYPEPWGDAVYFYHQAVRAEAYRSLGIRGDWAERLIERLHTHLQRDGSIINQRSPLMKENDPILCSTLALIAATNAEATNGVQGVN